MKELYAFLGEDCVSFVSWLWDHLSSNLSFYAQSKDLLSNDMAKSSRPLDVQHGRRNSSPERVHENIKTDSEYEREKLSKPTRSRRYLKWKGLVQEDSNPFPLRSTVTKILHSEERNNVSHNNRRSLSPKPHIVKKRSREDDRQPMKRDATSHPIISAPRRLLQFAVRDAVRTVQLATNSRPEPALKRLRSVVSTTTADSLLDERPQRLRSVARVPGALSTALKAAAEAAEDVTKDICAGSVFDRLSHGAYVSEPIKQPSAEPILQVGEYNHADQVLESSHAEYYQRSEYDGDFTGDVTMLDRDTAMPDDSASDNDGYNNVGGVRHCGFKASRSVASVDKEDLLTLQYSVAHDASEVVRGTRLMDQGPTSSAITKPSSKIVNISVNVNTRKPSHYQVPRDVSAAENQSAVDKTVVAIGKANSQLPKDNNNAMAENEIARADVQKESQKILASTPGSYTTNRPSDVDSRTVFVSNVHFAATKDTLSRHFNKFGEVLKVIIVNDAATGQPRGAAYVEFLRKESAESASSLNGTYFMSRSLKVVGKSSMQQEATMMGWPRVARASPFASRLNRAAFSRGVLHSAFRARLPVKSGARSLQWKREGPAQTTTECTKSTPNSFLTSGNNVSSPTWRNLTYVRPEWEVNAKSRLA